MPESVPKNPSLARQKLKVHTVDDEDDDDEEAYGMFGPMLAGMAIPGSETRSGIPPGEVGGSTAGRESISSTVSAPTLDDGGSESGKLGDAADTTLVFVHSEEAGTMCGGLIGGAGGARFCLETRHSCRVEAHKKSKIDLKLDHFYIKAPGRTKAALRSPSLPKKNLRAGDKFEEFVLGIKTVGFWRTAFLERLEALTPMSASVGPAWGGEEELEPSTLSDLAKGLEQFRSPGDMELVIKAGKAKLGGSKLDPAAVALSARSLDSLLLSEQVAAFGEIKDGPNLEAHKDHRKHAEQQGMVVKALVSDVASIRKDLNRGLDVVDSLSVSLRVVTNEVGNLAFIDHPLSGLTVWEAIESLTGKTTLEELRRENSVLRDELEQERRDRELTVGDLEVTVAQLGRAFKATTSYFKSTLEAHSLELENLKALGGGAKTVDTNPFLASGSFGPPPPNARGGRNVSWNEDPIRLRSDIDQLRTLMQDFINEQGNNDVEAMLPPNLQTRVLDLEDGLVDLKHRVIGTNTYEFDGNVYGGPGDVLKHLGESLDPVMIGMFFDIFTGMARLNERFGEGKELTDRIHSAQRLDEKISSMDAETMATMEMSTSLFLFEKNAGKKNPTRPEEGFGHRMATYAKFSGEEGTPVRSEIQVRLRKVINSIKGTIKGSGPAQSLAKHLLQEVTFQASELVGFISERFQELTCQCNFTREPAWNFIGICTRALLDHMVPPRLEVSALEDFASPDNKAKIIWAILSVHIRMKEIIDSKFVAHPVITTAMSNFLLKTRVDGTLVTTLDAKVKEVLKTTQTNDKKLVTVEADLKAHESSVKSDITFLKGKVAKI